MSWSQVLRVRNELKVMIRNKAVSDPVKPKDSDAWKLAERTMKERTHMSGFRKAERKQSKLKIAMTGPSGAGKTLSSLLMARGIVGPKGRIALIDTENGSASLYAKKVEFEVLEIAPPYENQKYLRAIREAVADGFDILIIDSLTHQWAGDGGLLNKKEQLDARGGNSYTNWAKMTPEHEALKAALLHSDIHIIGTIRSKQDYVLEQNDKGKQAPRKVGLAPIQRDGMEYEFTTVFDIAMNHEAQASKDRTDLFDGRMFKINEKTGGELLKWLNEGVETIRPVSQDQVDPNLVVRLNTQAPAGGPDTYAEKKQAQLKALAESEKAQVIASQTSENAPETTNVKPRHKPVIQPKEAPGNPSSQASSPVTSIPGVSEMEFLKTALAQNKWTGQQATEYMAHRFAADRLSVLTMPEFEKLIATIKSKAFNQAMADVDLEKEFLNTPIDELIFSGVAL